MDSLDVEYTSVQEVMAEFDTNRDGVVNFEEFCGMLAARLPSQ